MDERFIMKLQSVIEEHLEDENFSVEDLANQVAFSRSHLYRKIHSLTGLSISLFIRNIRLEKAYLLLEQEVATVSEIAFKVGFGSSTYFSKCFHEYYGHPPGDVRRNKNKADVEPPRPSNFKAQPRQGNTIETLHPSSDSPLIEEIFRALVKHKPSLEKFLIVEEGEGESLDQRLLAYQTIKCFPWPIGVELRRLFSSDFSAISGLRLKQINKTLRKCLRFLSFLYISELVEQGKNKSPLSKTEMGEEICILLKRAEDQDLVSLLKLLPASLKTQEKLFIPELEFVQENLWELELEAWLESLKESDSENLNQACEEAEQTLILVLKKLSFLARYRLVHVSAIKVEKPKFGEARFQHHYHFLNAIDADFKMHLESLDDFADSQAVLLMDSIKNTGEFLNLSPFIVDTYEEEGLDKQKIKRDVFLYHHHEKGLLHFEGSDLNQLESLAENINYEHWESSFIESLKILRRL
jgi:AraC-like DNA-binding protein